MSEIVHFQKETDNTIKFLAFRFYEGCPVGCAHCAISAPLSKPKRGKVTSEDVLRLVDLGDELNSRKLILMTGSEILIKDNDFRDLAAELVLGRKYTLGILTSAYWGKTERGLSEGILYLRLCGVSHIQLSIDSFHSSAISIERANEIAVRLQMEGFSVLINSTSLDGNIPKSTSSLDIPTRKLVFFPSSIGRGTELQSCTNIISNTQYHNCDFGNALYLQQDRNVYFCSGPGGMAKGRAIGSMEDSYLPYYSSIVPLLEKEIEKAIHHPCNKNKDGCSACASHFQKLDLPWNRGLMNSL